MAKIRINLSLDESTKERLERYAKQKHTTMSQLVTDFIWAQNVKDDKNIPGQETLPGTMKRGR